MVPPCWTVAANRGFMFAGAAAIPITLEIGKDAAIGVGTVFSLPEIAIAAVVVGGPILIYETVTTLAEAQRDGPSIYMPDGTLRSQSCTSQLPGSLCSIDVGPGLRIGETIEAVPIEDILDYISETRAHGKGERKHTHSSSGTNNPYKHMRPHPTDPTKVIVRDPQTGKQIVKPKPPDYPK